MNLLWDLSGKTLLVQAPEECGFALVLVTQTLQPVEELLVSACSGTDLVEVLE